ncbi:MAG: tRNA (N(6)-L-threonylcarbamoyladenosine(37)-C(2))-methylthiotransferase MtaB [Treponema sp.]|nr:tRNA (N(6)-L-threonylcarbamoyladenosine(37)-C(2))-methylthiotransferase MtaB [Treponema sp.]
MLSFLVQTLGCKLNQLESESLTDAFLKAGFRLLDKNERPDVSGIQDEGSGLSPSIVIINTCTVTSKADQKARRVIRKALCDYPDSCVIVTGCYAQLNREEILNLNLRNIKRLFVINKESILDLPHYLISSNLSSLNSRLSDLSSHLSAFCPRNVQNVKRNSRFDFNPQRFYGHTRSFLKIQDGCDKFCTYCRIRLARGPCISLEKEEVLSRLRLLEKSHAETVLTGVNICQYSDRGSEIGDFGLAELLDYLLNGTEKAAIRLSSLEPERIDDNFAKTLSNKRIRPHFHLSVQSGSAKILEKMGRSYNADTIERSVSFLRSAKDNPFLACDIITGFPGETQMEFDETFSLCQKLQFAWIHVFPYSGRPGTPAFSFSNKVKESDVTKRVQTLTALAERGKAEYIKSCLGRDVDVLIERKKVLTAKPHNGRGDNEAVYFSGITENYLKALVKCEGEALHVGSVLQCKVIEESNSEHYDAVVQPLLNVF